MPTAVEVEGLRLKFPGAEELLFRDLSLSVRPGEKVLLLGPSGCGKSTLLQVMSGLIPRSIEVPMQADRLALPSSWGYVFQDPDSQFCMPYVDEEMAFVLENLRVPRQEMTARIRGLLERVGLRLPDLHTPIARLSQGMKQRLAIAGALALEPEVLFLDEPTALLDPEGTEQVWETVKEACGTATMVIVEHKIERVADFASRIVLFDAGGRIVADGPSESVFGAERERLYSAGIWYPGVWDDWRERGGLAPEAAPRGGGAGAGGETGSEHGASGGSGAGCENGAGGEGRNGGADSGSDAGVGSGYDVMESGSDTGVRGRNDGTVSAAGEPLLELDGFAAIRDLAFRVELASARVRPGEWIAITGPNGAGKSSLLLGLMRLIDTEGRYLVRGRPAEQVRQLAGELAFVFQNPEFQFVTNAVYDEVAYALRLDRADEREVAARTEELLRLFGLEGHRSKHPYQLSMGQKRRLSVACAVIKEQRVLLLDEPTFGQDARNTFAILERLERWRRDGTTILMVTHDERIVEDCATREWHVRGGVVEELPAGRFRGRNRHASGRGGRDAGGETAERGPAAGKEAAPCG